MAGNKIIPSSVLLFPNGYRSCGQHVRSARNNRPVCAPCLRGASLSRRAVRGAIPNAEPRRPYRTRHAQSRTTHETAPPVLSAPHMFRHTYGTKNTLSANKIKKMHASAYVSVRRSHILQKFLSRQSPAHSRRLARNAHILQKFLSRRSPASPLFSGWNCTPYTLPAYTAEG